MKSALKVVRGGLFVLAAVFGIGKIYCQDSEVPVRIASVEYEISGSFWKLKKAALEKELLLDTKKSFKDEEELSGYLKIKEQNLRDNRSIKESAQISYSLLAEENGIIPAAVTVRVENSKTFIAAPYPKYSSSKGFEAKIKMKDSNFLGSLYPLEGELSYLFPSSGSCEPQTFNAALSGGYVFPLKGGFLSPWFSGQYTAKSTDDRYEKNSGFVSGGTEFLLPATSIFSLKTGLSAGLVYDYEVPEDFPYMSFSASAAAPILLAENEAAGKILFTPKVAFTQNTAFHSAGGAFSLPEYEYLKSPSVELGAEFSLGAVHWKENFRDGFSFSAGVSMQNCFYDFSQDFFSSVQAQFHKAFTWSGISARGNFLAGRTEQKIGRRENAALTDFVRGVGAQEKETFYDTDLAFVLNLDFPVRIFSTISAFRKAREDKTERLLDFEIHASPFIDFAYARLGAENSKTTDGILTAGLELICWPLSFRSIQLRASFGKDFSSKIFSAGGRPGSGYELTIGIGLFY